MDRISSLETYLSTDDVSIYGLFSQSFLFVKFRDLSFTIPGYKKTVLVGKNEGVSGTIIGGYNIGVCKYIDEEHRDAAIKVIEFFTSEEYQKKLATIKKVSSGMRSIYDEEEVCKIVDCEMEKQHQPIAEPNNIDNNYNEFSNTFYSIIRSYFYGQQTASETLEEISKAIKSYSISDDSISDDNKNSSGALLSISLSIVFTLVITITVALLQF
ncbi:hypothetical protein BCR36DRAFT_455298 [Piromyces finnis]|uniref:Periplasmic binding protein-like II n=1 Tax=Piromyces finnis TaxID=1754191 RepID=A0A1Y1V483_9FUNG|nr:hypothetical protein BCR36DRAFT_455298 [Piromyces finnis]|eukprot:ORX46909.1 hypothetical protein BCR36DRAFT_455298 [Piromyces finnis]